MDRRNFFKNAGIAASGLALASTPWLSVFSEQKHTVGSRLKIGVVGTGSRGQYLMSFLAKNPKAEIVALCDIYQPSLDGGLGIAPKAKTYTDHRALLDDPEIEAVVVATPLNVHFRVVMDAFDAGKPVYCEKSIGYDIDQCFQIYNRHRETGLVFFAGQQRLFDPRYVRAMEMIHQGMFGEIEGIRAYWFRNGDWRRDVPSPELEHQINWRLYRESSKGLMTELACHQLQVGSWAMRRLPDTVMGHGSITCWKDGREVYDNLSCIYVFDNGVKMNYESVISNKFYGLEEQILGHNGTVEPEKGRYYFETIPPAPAFLQMLNDIEHSLFDSMPFAGTSWAPETANPNRGEFILGRRPEGDGTEQLTQAFVEAAITGQQPPAIAEECYYASALALWGDQALQEGRILTFPDEYKLDYLNHKQPTKTEATA
jgi:predicted dehydrogenase